MHSHRRGLGGLSFQHLERGSVAGAGAEKSIFSIELALSRASWRHFWAVLFAIFCIHNRDPEAT